MMGEILEGKCGEVAGEVKAVVGEVDGATYAHNVGESSHTLEFDPPVTVTLRTVNVEVSVC